MGKKIEIQEGQKFGRWTFLKDTDSIIVSDKKVRMVICKCDCGNERSVALFNLRNGKSLSCGCLQKEIAKKIHTTHDEDRKSITEYTTWLGMKQRCNNTKHTSYKNYGGRGIKVCARWNDYINFLQDMGRKPGPEYTLDRINSNGNYEPSNCRWEKRSKQNSNRRTYNRRKKIIG